MSAIVLRAINPARQRFREYAMSIQPGLFDEWCLWTHWGRIGASGQQRRYWYSTYEEAAAHQQKLLKRRKRNGYRPAYAASETVLPSHHSVPLGAAPIQPASAG